MEQEKYKQIERSIITKFRKTVWSPFVDAVKTYEMISEGDKIAVCISGGKDSMLLAKCMEELKRHGKIPFDLIYLVMDPGYNEVNRRKIEDNAKILNIPVVIFESDIFEVTENMAENPCYLCARMRRGCLYNKAKELGCNKIALGHHFNDVIETVLMSMLYGAEIKTMMPKLHSTNFKGMELIRPLYLVKEEDIISWKNSNGLDFIQCACRLTERENSGKGEEGKRKEIKNLIAELKKINNNVDINIFRSTHNVNTDTLIGYRNDEEGVQGFLDIYNRKRKSKNKLGI